MSVPLIWEKMLSRRSRSVIKKSGNKINRAFGSLEMFDAKYLDNIAKNTIFVTAVQRLSVGKKMVELGQPKKVSRRR